MSRPLSATRPTLHTSAHVPSRMHFHLCPSLGLDTAHIVCSSRSHLLKTLSPKATCVLLKRRRNLHASHQWKRRSAEIPSPVPVARQTIRRNKQRAIDSPSLTKAITRIHSRIRFGVHEHHSPAPRLEGPPISHHSVPSNRGPRRPLPRAIRGTLYIRSVLSRTYRYAAEAVLCDSSLEADIAARVSELVAILSML